MPKLILSQSWRNATRAFEPGEYDIPRDIGMTDAKCARADGAGRIELPGKAVPAVKAFRAAPENKRGGVYRDNRPSMAGGSGRGKRSKSDR